MGSRAKFGAVDNFFDPPTFQVLAYNLTPWTDKWQQIANLCFYNGKGSFGYYGLVIFRISIDSINGASMAHIPEIGGTFTVFLVS